MVFVQHDSDLAIARAEHDLDVKSNESAQTLLGIGDATDGIEHALVCDLHGMVHDFEQDLVLALKVVVEAAFAQLESGSDIVHGSGVVAALLE